jgi:hypothetical protein
MASYSVFNNLTDFYEIWIEHHAISEKKRQMF